MRETCCKHRLIGSVRTRFSSQGAVVAQETLGNHVPLAGAVSLQEMTMHRRNFVRHLTHGPVVICRVDN